MPKIDLTAGTAVSLALGGIASVALMLVWGGFWSGLTLSFLWGWFVSPTFGLPALSLLQAYGLVLVARFVQGFEVNKTGSESLGGVMAGALVRHPFVAGLTLSVGWIVKSCM